MPEIKIKHVISFSSEDKVHKAENILRTETYRKWKCAKPGEKNATILMQFEKATQIHKIDIGNESSAFVEVLVGRSSDAVSDYEVLLVASSFMTPNESRNEIQPNRVRMFESDHLSQTVKEQKWDCVQVVCTQPFNKNITYGLSFIKFHSPPEKNVPPAEKDKKKASMKLGAFNIKYDDDEEEDSSLPEIGSWQERKDKNTIGIKTKEKAPSFAASVLASPLPSPQQRKVEKRKQQDSEVGVPPSKKEATIKHVNRNKLELKDAFGARGEDDSSASSNRDDQRLNQKVPLPNRNKVVESKAGPSQKKAKEIKKVPFHKVMDKVVFVLSGFVNPLRSELRDKALEMGAKYKGDWDRSCTHLVCAFANTPKYVQVKGQGGKIVTKEWIIESYKKRLQLPWRQCALGTYSRDSTEEEESEIEEEEIAAPLKTKKKNSEVNGTSPKKTVKKEGSSKVRSLFPESDESEEESVLPPQRETKKESPTTSKRAVIADESETEDEDALQDYVADTDVDDGSGGDTEDEIMKIEEEEARKKRSAKKSDVKDFMDDDDDDDTSLLSSKIDTSDLPLPELPNLFKQRHFFLYGDFSPKVRHDLKRFIMAFHGVVDEYMGDTVKYVITESKWDKNFEEALAENEDLIFVKPEWVWKCKEAEKLVPYQAFIVIPD